MNYCAAVALITALLLPSLADAAACRCTSVTSVTGKVTTTCRCADARTATCTSTTSLTGVTRTVCR